MFKAFGFFQFTSFKNLLLFRIRRLRQPKYFLGAIAGVAYFYFIFWRRISGVSFGNGTPKGHVPELAFSNVAAAHVALVAIAAAVFFVVICCVWIFSTGPAALRFSEAEITFLFPAPLSRASLIHYRLLKMQVGTLLQAAAMTVTLSAILARGAPSVSGPKMTHFIGWWIVLSVFALHQTGASFFRASFANRESRLLHFRAWVLIALGATLSAVWFISRGNFRPPQPLDLISAEAMVLYVGEVLSVSSVHLILIPFRWIVAPYFASSTGELVKCLAPAAAVVAIHYLWIIRSKAPFEEATVAVAQKRTERQAALHSGNWARTLRPVKASRGPFRLSTRGTIPGALLWKNLLGAGPWYHPKILFRCAVIITIGLTWVSSQPEWNRLLVILGATAITCSMMLLFAGPQIARQDFRTDLCNVDLLKSYPVAAWKIALGELLAPVSILSGIQWLLIMVISFAFIKHRGASVDSTRLYQSIAFGAAAVVPFFYTLVLIIPNGMALIFPSWVLLGRDNRGIEALGQRLILGFAQVFILAMAVLPAAILALATWFLTSWLVGDMASIGLATAAVIGILAAEAALGIWFLGYWFERFDASGEVVR